MTCIDKLRLDHPEYGVGIILDYIKSNCPNKYLTDPEYCPEDGPTCACIDCWMREVPEQTQKDIEITKEIVSSKNQLRVAIHTADLDKPYFELIDQVFEWASKIKDRDIDIRIM